VGRPAAGHGVESPHPVQHSSYLLLLFALFVVPRFLQRYRFPTAITSFSLGALGSLYFREFVGDETIALFATLGIVSLFLFAGLDVEFRELRRHATILVQHLLLQVLTLAALTFVLQQILQLSLRPATLVALALLTPSTGFILDSLADLRLPERIRFWVKSKAIATEMVALGVLFVGVKSESAHDLGTSALVMVAMVAFLPLAFRGFAALILPHAPKSEFAFLMMVATACAIVTHELGVYYLVGAFVVGMGAQRLRESMPALSSEKMLSSVESFSSLFVPFYFFNAGLGLRAEDFSLLALGTGLLFTVLGLVLRLFPVWLHRRLVFGESLNRTLLVGLPMLPTLVFTLVIAGILREQFQIAPALFGGLIVYAILNSLAPGLIFRRGLPEIEDELRHERSVREPAECRARAALPAATPEGEGA